MKTKNPKKRRTKGKNPTARSLELLRASGWTAQVVERFNQFAMVRQDLFGFIDIVAVHPNHKGVLAIQTTTFEHGQDRLRKICKEPRAMIWAQAENPIEVWTWRKTKKSKWEVTVLQVTIKQSSETSS